LTVTAAARQQPNVVLILADDLGYGSMGCYGADPELVRTPRIDRLAGEGIRFTNAHVPSTVCSPTRYSLLTGRYCWRTPADHGVLGVYAPLLIETDRMTLASVFRQSGYTTAAIGKWHLGYGTVDPVDFRDPLVPGPLQIGFDYHFAIPANHGDETGVYVENEKVWGLRSKKLTPIPGCFYGNKDYIGLDAPQRTNETAMAFLTDKSIDWMKASVEKERPFFLYFALPLPHAPITPSEATAGSSKAGPYGDFLHDMDASVGRVLDALDAMGVADNTLVIFTSDNGGSAPDYGRHGPVIQQALDAGLKVNGPLRWRKHSIFEGGSRVPFIVRWPQRIPESGTSSECIGLVDLFASMATLLNVELPADSAQDSVSVLDALLGGSSGRLARVPMITHSSDGNFAVRIGPWKYIEGRATHPNNALPMWREGYEAQLYNVEDDIAEIQNRISEFPELAERMQKEIDRQRAQGFSRPGAKPYVLNRK
jgi:arylsulfatase A-like enzyme